MHRSEHRRTVAARFSREAKRFVDWADGDRLDAAAALRRVAQLYAAALELPQPWSERAAVQRLSMPASLVARLDRVRERAAAIPLQHYSEIFSPGVPPD